jgi:hypothetical protein
MVYNPEMRRAGDTPEELSRLTGSAEAAVTRMYEPRQATAGYALAKDFFADAIGMAERLGLAEESARLRSRLAEVKAVFRGQGFG